MINEQIMHLVKQLSKKEKMQEYQHIKDTYSVGAKTTMLRDDIRDKIFELLYADFPFLEKFDESNDLEVIHLGQQELVDFSATLIKEFSLEDIEFSEIKEWEVVADIINTVDLQLSESYINGFEPEV